MANETTPKPSVEATLTDTPAPTAPIKGAWAREEARREAILTGAALPVQTGYVEAPGDAQATEIIHHRGVKEDKNV